MPKILRSKKAIKRIWIILSLLIIPAFCLWGFGSVVRGKKKPVFLGRVFGKSISVQEYLRNYKAVRNRLLVQLGADELGKLEKYLNLEAQAWDRIILLTEAKRKRIRASNKEVVDWISQSPIFFRKEGFDPALYQETITYVFRISPRAFEEEVRDNLIIAKLYEKTTEKITVNDHEIKDAYIKENEQISLDYILASIEDFLNQVSVEDNELLDYYNQNPQAFRKPVSYNLEYISVDIKDKQTVKKIAQSVNQGFNLGDIAKDGALEVKETGFFSSSEPIPQIGFSTEILRILPKLKSQGKPWPQPIQTDADIVYFVGLKEKREPYIPSFDHIKDKVNQRLSHQKASRVAQERLNACRNETDVSGFKETAKKFNLKIGKTKLFKRQGYVEGLGDSDIFFEAVENLKENEVSQIISAPSGLYIVKLKERIKPDEKEFQKERQDFASSLLQEKREDYFRQFLTELKNRPKTFIIAAESFPRNR
jgi:hypothetical protein